MQLSKRERLLISRNQEQSLAQNLKLKWKNEIQVREKY